MKSESRPKSPDADIRNRFDEWYGNMFDKKNDNLAMSRTKVSESSIPLIRPESLVLKWIGPYRDDLMPVKRIALQIPR